MPPNTATFDGTNLQPLHASRRMTGLANIETPTPVPASTMGAEIRDLASLLLVQAVRDMRKDSNTPTLTTPMRSSSKSQPVAPPVLSPPTNTPSKLSRFLEYAETTLGVRNATIYERELWQLGIGPDIIDKISDETLLKVGFSIGDVIRLKDGGSKWWLGPDAKRKRGESVIEPSGLTNPISRPTKKMVFYDMRYKDGGGKRFSAPAMKVAEDGLGNAETDEYTLYYELGDHKIWLPVPRGYEVPVDGTEDDLDDPFN
jgi:hypothetical protein